MQISGKPTTPEIREATRIMRSNLTWTRLLARQAYALVIAGIVVWQLAGAFTSSRPVNWHNVDLLLAVLAVLLVFSWMRIQRILGSSSARMTQDFPDTIRLESNGIQMSRISGANSFAPWNTFKSWRIGKQVVLLNYAEGKRYLILPVSSLSMPEQQSLQGTVQSNLGPAANRK